MKLFKILFKLSIQSKLELKMIEEKWKAFNLPTEKFDLIVQLGGFKNEVVWQKFLPICCSTISKVKDYLAECQILNTELKNKYLFICLGYY